MSTRIAQKALYVQRETTPTFRVNYEVGVNEGSFTLIIVARSCESLFHPSQRKHGGGGVTFDCFEEARL